MHEISLSLQDLLLEDFSNTETLMDVQESGSVMNPLLLPPNSGSAKVDPTQGAKSRRKSKSLTDDAS